MQTLICPNVRGLKHLIALIVLATGSLHATAQPTPGPRELPAQAAEQRMFGAGAPFRIEDLPQSPLRADLEGLNGKPAAQQKALKHLHSFSFPASDAASLRVDDDGGVFYVDPVRPEKEPTSRDKTDTITNASAPTVRALQLSISPENVFQLHSKPGAARTIYLNFEGAIVSGTAWNASSGRPSHNMLPFSEDGDYSTFNQSELNIIAEVWKRISEDFAPFDVNITTEKPVSFGPQTGHLLFSPRIDADGYPIYASAAGGVAYVNFWGASNFTYYQPALVFPEGTGRNAHYMAEAGAHEMGHNLGLSHDGRTSPSEGYYQGHGTGWTSWAPIMGVGYYQQVTQWSKGEYANANQTQDDLAIISSKLTTRPDDHADFAASATPLVVSNSNAAVSTTLVSDPQNTNPQNKGIIETRNDVDYFYIDTPSGIIDLIITPVWLDVFKADTRRGANLDIKASLLDADGTLIITSTQTADTFAQVTTSVDAGRYFLKIEGEGAGPDATTGYTDYGSLGYYFINGTLPAGSSSEPNKSLTVSRAGTGGGRVTSSPTGIDCGADCSQDYISGQSVTLTATPSSGSVFTGWSGGGCSGSAVMCTVSMSGIRTVSATFTRDPILTPSNLTGVATSKTQVHLTWRDNSTNETGFRVERSTNNKSFSVIATLSADAQAYADSGLKANTNYYYRVSAFNAGGSSGFSNTVPVKTPR